MAPKTQKPQAAQQAPKFADGGQVQAGLQPTLAIGYADGGSLDRDGRGPWTGDLNSRTTSFNQDWLRGPTFGDQNYANLINYAPPAPAEPAVSASSSSSPMARGEAPDNYDPIGVGMLSDARNEDILQGMGKNMLLGGPTSAILGAGLAGYQFNSGVLDKVNASSDPIGKLAGLQGWSMENGANPMQKDPMQMMQERQAASVEQAPTLPDATPAAVKDGVAPETPAAEPAPAEEPAPTPADAPAPTLDTPAAGLQPAPIVNNDPDWQINAAHDAMLNGGSTGSGYKWSGSADNSQMQHTETNSGGETTTGGFGSSASAADGGMATPGGFQQAQAAPPGPPGLQMPGQPQQAPQADPMHPALASLHVQNKLANPQVIQAIKAHLDQAIQAGQLNPQQLQMMGQLAQSALQHPELWPKLRQFAIQAGLPDAQQLPMQFNQQIAMALMAAAQASQHGDRPGAMANGGMIHGPGTGISDSIPAHNASTGQPLRVANGEYIIPADVVATKGKEFFDNIVRKYHTPAALQHGR